MPLDFEQFDTRRYPVLDVKRGYGEWSVSYDKVFVDLLDRPLLERVRSVDFAAVSNAVDLACGTGRIGAWLKERRGDQSSSYYVDGLDLTPEMMAQAHAKGLYRE